MKSDEKKERDDFKKRIKKEGKGKEQSI